MGLTLTLKYFTFFWRLGSVLSSNSLLRFFSSRISSRVFTFQVSFSSPISIHSAPPTSHCTNIHKCSLHVVPAPFHLSHERLGLCRTKWSNIVINRSLTEKNQPINIVSSIYHPFYFYVSCQNKITGHFYYWKISVCSTFTVCVIISSLLPWQTPEIWRSFRRISI